MRGRVVGEYAVLTAWVVASILVVIFARGSPYSVAFATFGAVVAASLLIAWAAEAAEFSISRGLALAIVAIVQTIPEYFVEGTIAWKAGHDVQWVPNVIANFTGANRLLTGFGWPLILFTLAVQKRRNGRTGPTTIALRREQSIELIFLLGASLYYVWILIEGALTLIDSLILGGAFVAYMWMLSRIPADRDDQKEEVEGPSLAIAEIKSKRRKTALIIGLFLFGGLTFVLITDAFVESVRGIAETFLRGLLGSGAVFFSIQWIAPVLSEFPEKVTAFNWARRITLAPVALLNFISSAVNELTALVALIPIVFVVSRGAIAPVPVQDHSVEILLTMAQSLYAFATLLDLEYSVDNALVLLVLWAVSTAFVEVRLWIAIIFLIMAAVETARTRGRIIVFSAFRRTLRNCFRRDGSKDGD